MKLTKEMISTDIAKYVEKITYINSCIEVYDYLSASRVLYNNEMNIAPAFFGMTMSAMARTIVLESSKLFDMNSDKNIDKLLKCCENNKKMFGEELIRRELVDVDGVERVIKTSEKINLNEVIIDLRNEYDNLSATICKIKHQRDKVLAHADKKYFYDNKKMSAENPISINEFKVLMEYALKVCNLFNNMLNDGKTFRGIYANVGDIENLFDALQRNSANHN